MNKCYETSRMFSEEAEKEFISSFGSRVFKTWEDAVDTFGGFIIKHDESGYHPDFSGMYWRPGDTEGSPQELTGEQIEHMARARLQAILNRA